METRTFVVVGLAVVLALLPVVACEDGRPQLADIVLHSVDDVAPALKNATSSALDSAHKIIASYSNILIAAAIPFGAVCTFFGYYLLGPVLFIAAFIVGGCASFVAVRAALDKSEAAAWASIVAMVIGGGFCGFAAVQMLAVGMFAVGAALGVATSTALKGVLWTKLFPKSPHAGYIFGCVLLGIIFGIIALALRKQMFILSTSYAGSFAMFFGIGHFAGHFPTLAELDKAEHGVFNPWVVLYLSLTAFFGTAGMFIQFHITRDKPMPSRAPYSRRRVRHGRIRSLSPHSAWSVDDAEWERELLATSQRIRGGSVRSNSSAGHDSKLPHDGNEFSNKPLADIETGSDRREGGDAGLVPRTSVSIDVSKLADDVQGREHGVQKPHDEERKAEMNPFASTAGPLVDIESANDLKDRRSVKALS